MINWTKSKWDICKGDIVKYGINYYKVNRLIQLTSLPPKIKYLLEDDKGNIIDFGASMEDIEMTNFDSFEDIRKAERIMSDGKVEGKEMVEKWFKKWVKDNKFTKELDTDRVLTAYEITIAYNSGSYLNYYQQCLEEVKRCGYDSLEINQMKVAAFTETEWQYVKENADNIIKWLYTNDYMLLRGE